MVAWSKKYKETETKCFLRCKAWRNTAEFLGKYFVKGQEIIVEGELNTEEWTDKDSNKKSHTILSVEQIHFCGSKGDSKPAANINAAAALPTNPADFEEIILEDGELPF